MGCRERREGKYLGDILAVLGLESPGCLKGNLLSRKLSSDDCVFFFRHQP